MSTIKIKLNHNVVTDDEVNSFVENQFVVTIETFSIHEELDEVHIETHFPHHGDELALLAHDLERDFWEWYSDKDIE